MGCSSICWQQCVGSTMMMSSRAAGRQGGKCLLIRACCGLSYGPRSHCRERSVELEQQLEAVQGETAQAQARLEQQAAEHEAAQTAAAARIAGVSWHGSMGRQMRAAKLTGYCTMSRPCHALLMFLSSELPLLLRLPPLQLHWQQQLSCRLSWRAGLGACGSCSRRRISCRWRRMT